MYPLDDLTVVSASGGWPRKSVARMAKRPGVAQSTL
jgi:hypothetical protein